MLGIDDFATIWAGPRAFLLGIDPYDPATWREVAVRIGTAHIPDNAVYVYPPWVTIALVPFALLSTTVGTVVWSVIGLGAAILAMRALLRAYLPDRDWAHGVIGLLLVVSAPAAVTYLTGQWTFFFVAALAALVLCLRARRPVAAGLLSVVMLVKPPLFVFTALGLAVRALWPRSPDPAAPRFVLVAAGAGIATIAISWLILPSWWPAWLVHVAAVQVGIEPVTVQTLFIQLFGPNGGWLAPPVILAMVAAALQFDPRSDGWVPVWLALSSAAVVYSNTYDLLLLLVPMVVCAGVVRSRVRSTFVILSGAVLLLIVMWYLHTIYVRGYAAGVALLMFVIITGALWPERRVVTGSATSAPGSAGSSRP
jgi:hypothetical protein